jgi:hypothetical protein
VKVKRLDKAEVIPLDKFIYPRIFISAKLLFLKIGYQTVIAQIGYHDSWSENLWIAIGLAVPKTLEVPP